MKFFDPKNLAAVTQGRLIRLHQDPCRLTGVGTDSRNDLTQKAFIALRGKKLDGHNYLFDAVSSGAPFVIIDQRDAAGQVPSHVGVLLVHDCRQALGHLARAYRNILSNTKVIAITGSFGKSTTKELLRSVLSTSMSGTTAPKSFNNDIGVPLTILAASQHDEFLIVEIGTNAPGEIEFLGKIAKPDIAVITGIGHSHLEGLGTIDDVLIEKASLLKCVHDNGVAFINADHDDWARVLDQLSCRTIRYGENVNTQYRLTRSWEEASEWKFEINGARQFTIPLPGRHNALNSIAAVAVAEEFGIHTDAIQRGLLHATTLPMRMECVQLGDIAIWNDAYNANPESTRAALNTFVELSRSATRRVIILGDMLELGDESEAYHREIGMHLRKIHEAVSIDEVVLVGEHVKHIADVLLPSFGQERVLHVPDATRQSAERIFHELRDGDSILLKASRGIQLERLIEHFRQFTSLHALQPH